MLNFPTD